MNPTKIAHLTIQTLQQTGVPVTPGTLYIPRKLLSKKIPPLKEIQRRLAKFHGSLAEELADLRKTE